MTTTTTMTANGIKIENHSGKRRETRPIHTHTECIAYTHAGQEKGINQFVCCSQAVNAMLQCSTFDLPMVGTHKNHDASFQ